MSNAVLSVLADYPKEISGCMSQWSYGHYVAEVLSVHGDLGTSLMNADPDRLTIKQARRPREPSRRGPATSLLQRYTARRTEVPAEPLHGGRHSFAGRGRLRQAGVPASCKSA